MVKYTISEYSYRTGSGCCIGSADHIEKLPWEACDALNTYAVMRDSATIAEFEGCDVLAARAWLIKNPGYDGYNGCKVWKDECDYCGGALRDGRCNCVDSAERYNRAMRAVKFGHITRATREAFAGCSTGSYRGLTRSDYYETKVSAICAFDAELARWGLQLDPYDLSDFIGNSGRKILDVCTIGDGCSVRVARDGRGVHVERIGCAVLSWYRVPSGRYEFTGYLT